MFVAVIDDQESSLAGFSQILRRVADVEPVCFKKGVDALHWLNGVNPAFIVVNNSLADIGGIEFIRRLRIIAGREVTPVIFTTNKPDRDTRRAVFELDVYAFLEKPINPSEFLVHAMHIVDNYRQRADMEIRLREIAARAAEASAAKPAAAVDDDETVISAMLDVAILHDKSIAQHHKLAAQLAGILGREAKLTNEEQQLIVRAARIYDIGKVAIPQRILETRIAATPADRVTIEKHCDAGTRLLAGRETPLMRAATVIAQTHHERYDGSGYPRKLKGSSIPIMGRVIAVADALSAMLRARNDRPAVTLAQAIEAINRGSGTMYDPTVVHGIRSGLSDISRIIHETQQSAQAS